MAGETEIRDHATSQSDTGVKRRWLLRFGTPITAFTGASAISAIGASRAEAGPGDKPPPTTYAPMSKKGAPLGVATLETESKISPALLPDLSATIWGTTGVAAAGPAHTTKIVPGNFSVDANGGVCSPSIVNSTSYSNSRVQLTTTGTLVHQTVTDNNPILRVENGSATSMGDVLQAIGIAGWVGSRFNMNTYFITSKSAPPADAELSSNDAAIWFGSTNGAAKLTIKAKQADGTVKTGSVTLA